MKNSVTSALILLCLAFGACGKKNDTTTSPKAQIKLLTKIGKVSAGGTDTIFTYISYDNKNRISEIKTGSSIKAYNYTGDDLTSITYKDLSGTTLSTQLTFTYNSGIIAGGHAPNTNAALDYTYTYSVQNGQVINGPGQPSLAMSLRTRGIIWQAIN